MHHGISSRAHNLIKWAELEAEMGEPGPGRDNPTRFSDLPGNQRSLLVSPGIISIVLALLYLGGWNTSAHPSLGPARPSLPAVVPSGFRL